MVRKITWHSENGNVGSDRGDTIEVDDDATDEEIDAIIREEVFNYFSWGWSEAVK